MAITAGRWEDLPPVAQNALGEVAQGLTSCNVLSKDGATFLVQFVDGGGELRHHAEVTVTGETAQALALSPSLAERLMMKIWQR